ncbi:hypothetical protein M1K46_02360 [Fictibacillus sp. WQ 8-8]|uniref:DnaA N-terminal domain-containing protein n=1 Tax=Fictibacillus sp. WQ 8-8 TaxID=2938788 RepID=UPI00210E56BA|nr:DnaA N-terminal domain-containing protein [Fictibacillus sp. WQ 8-8]MCQ6264509.1 hypothetical protein [Fictibacillus sp. WQ 8-8]
MTAIELWDLTLKEIKDKISAPAYNQWFKPTMVGHIDGSTLVVLCEDEMQRNWLEARYTSLVSEIAYEIDNNFENVLFILHEKSGFLN